MSVSVVIGLFVFAWSLPLVAMLVLFIAHVRAERREDRHMADVSQGWAGQP